MELHSQLNELEKRRERAILVSNLKNSPFFPLIKEFVKHSTDRLIKEIIKIKHTDKNALFYSIANLEVIDNLAITFENIESELERINVAINDFRERIRKQQGK